jgi:hypothetical protein
MRFTMRQLEYFVATCDARSGAVAFLHRLAATLT